MAIVVPPIEFDNFVESQVGDQIHHMMRHYDGRRFSIAAFCLLDNGPKRGSMQVIEVGMRHQYQVNCRQVAQMHSWFAQPLEDKQPTGEVGINDDVLSADL